MQPVRQYNAPLQRTYTGSHNTPNPLQQNLSIEHFQAQTQPVRLYPENPPYVRDQIKRPMSQLPQGRNFDRSTNASREFGGTNPLQPLNTSAMGRRMDKTELRDQISTKNLQIKELQVNHDFFKEQTELRFKEYQDRIRLEIKAKIFDKVLKSNLHYIYKHYENLKNISSYEASKILEANLEKPRKELEEVRAATNALEAQNARTENKLREDALKPSLIKTTKNIVENVDKETVSRKMAEMEADNRRMEEQLKSLKQWRDQRLYDLKFRHEMKGRRAMEERAINLALKYVNPNNPEHRQLEGTIRRLLEEIQHKNEAKKASEVYHLLAAKEKLLKQLEARKNV